MPTLEVQNAQVHVHREGRGTPLLMLHGNPDSHRLWLPLIERLKDRHDCIAPDLPGFGASSVPPVNDVTLAGFARWVDELVTALGLTGPVDLICHDIGGFYGLAWAARYPQRLRRLVITNTLLHPDYRWHFWARVWRSRLGELSMRAVDWPLIGKAALGWTLRLGGPGLSPEQIDETLAGFHPTAREQVLRIYRETDPGKFAPWTAPLEACIASHPTMVLWGARDPFIPGTFADRFGRARVERLPNVGHWAVAEDPMTCAALVAAHLADADCAPV